ncbi:hypothetical protein L53_10495 [Hyphomonas sp. L-53-1-40]|nr:hypothetical protein L53_10495 [Hyphomonas sp. L-53-1-40]
MAASLNSSTGTALAFGEERRIWLPIKSDPGRFLMAVIPAAAVTIGLFAIMNHLIHVEEVRMATPSERILDKIVFDADPMDDPVRPDRPIFEPIEAKAPPPPPKVTMSSSDVGMPAIVDVGAVPTRTPVGSLGPIITTSSPVGDRTPVPVWPPLPAYPSAMAKRNLEGDCVVRFNLTARGLPFDVIAECTPSGFESEARRSVSRAEFLPQIIDGQAQESRGLSYPLEFRLNEE